jgi:hypothetical protein
MINASKNPEKEKIGIVAQKIKRRDLRGNNNIKIQVDAAVLPKCEEPHDVGHVAPGPIAGLQDAAGEPLFYRCILDIFAYVDPIDPDVFILE